MKGSWKIRHECNDELKVINQSNNHEDMSKAHMCMTETYTEKSTHLFSMDFT